MAVADLIEPTTDFLAAGAVFVALETFDVVFLMTVEVLDSLDSLVVLTFRLGRVVDADGGCVAALRFRPGPVLELAAEEVVTFLVAGAGRVPLAFSTIPERILEDGLVGMPFTGEAGRLIIDFVGEAGLSLGKTRVLEVVGDRTCDGATSVLA